MSETGRSARTFKIGEEEVTVFFNLNAQFAVEAELDKSVSEIIRELEYATFNATTARVVLWAGLQGAGKKITLEKAGEYDVGHLEAMHLQVALSKSQATKKEIEELGDKIIAVDEANRRKTNEVLDKAKRETDEEIKELRRPPTKKRGGKGGKRTRG